MPPLAMAAARFLIAGSLLFTWVRVRGAPAPTVQQWKSAAISGTLLLAGGNGAVVVAEQWVASGLVALLVASVPLWLVILDAIFGSRTRPSARTTAGLLVGFAGVGLLAASPGRGTGGSSGLFGTILILCGSLSWAAGSLLSRYMRDRPRPRMLVSMQMLGGGGARTIVATLAGEWGAVDILERGPTPT